MLVRLPAAAAAERSRRGLRSEAMSAGWVPMT